MKVSIIIVSYNVYPFLDNCLRSVRQSLQGIEGEIIVVDNASVDRTPALVKEFFPDVTLIANQVNVGFAKANNQGIRIARGEYILMLNPDTVLSEDTLAVCIRFAEENMDAGAIGVRMIDGSGKFLPESKRGLPTLGASFMKMTGLYHLSPHSKIWNRYYQGHVKENETAKIEVLTGAFMFMRKTALAKAGYLDEDFFMYGEDIDLSYRITKAGYSIYYLPTTNIIHYKGESTKKASFNYVITFYQAMLIFNQKHPEFKGQKLLIHLAIYLHGVFRLIRQTLIQFWPAILDGVMVYMSFYIMGEFWARVHFKNADYFPSSFYLFNIPLYLIVFMMTMFFNGAYDKPFEQRRTWLGYFSGVMLVLITYALLPVPLRTSRMVLALGSICFAVGLWISRSKFYPWQSDDLRHQEVNRRAIIVGNADETNRIKELINRSRDQIDIIGTVRPEEKVIPEFADSLGTLNNLEEIVRVHDVKEIIFSAADVPFSAFSGSMSKLGPGYRYMLAASTTMNIVGSMNRDTEGESYGLRINFNLSHPSARRIKRVFDLFSSLVFFILSPIILLFIKNKQRAFIHILEVIQGKRTWVSYNPADPMIYSLPPIPKGVLYPAYQEGNENALTRLEHIHYVYARDYHWTTDLSILIQQWQKIGQLS